MHRLVAQIVRPKCVCHGPSRPTIGVVRATAMRVTLGPVVLVRLVRPEPTPYQRPESMDHGGMDGSGSIRVFVSLEIGREPEIKRGPGRRGEIMKVNSYLPENNHL